MGGLSHMLLLGRCLLAAGLVLVLFARGCDQIGARGIARTAAARRAAEQQFEDKWTENFAGRDEQIRTLKDKKDRTADDEKAIIDAEKSRTEMTETKANEKLKLGKDWRALEADANSAQTGNAMWGYWREICFAFGSVILAMGLLVVSWNAKAPSVGSPW